MTINLKSPAPEYNLSIGLSSSIFLTEIKEFIDRNKIDEEHHCERCLNAHIVRKSRDLSIGLESMKSMVKEMKDEIGHDGYYIDEGNLVKL